jgi:hypothetical protein
MTMPSCCRTLLARGPCAEVTRCSCGHIHLSIGPVTLRVDEDTLHAAWHTMGDALRTLAAGHQASEKVSEPEPRHPEWKQ